MRLIFPLFRSHRFKSEQSVRILISKVANLILTFTDLIWDDHTLRCTSLKYLTNQGLTALASISRFQRSSIKFEVAINLIKYLAMKYRQGVRQIQYCRTPCSILASTIYLFIDLLFIEKQDYCS